MKRQRVNRANRCPVCNSDTWCLIGDDAALCMRVVSENPHQLSDGSVGYWHSLSEPRPVWRQPVKHKDTVIDVRELVNGWIRKTMPSQFNALADRLGVRASGLTDLHACYAEEHQAWAFPMSDGFGNWVGIRLRNYLGDKWAVKGSHSGVFMPIMVVPQQVLVVCEGPTDTAAVLSMGMYAIGRPSCSGGAKEIIQLIGRNRVNKVLIISDNDPKRRRDGTPWNPGIEGSLRLQEQLPVPSCIVALPCKDIREFVNRGGQPRDLEYLVKSMRWHYPRPHETNQINQRRSGLPMLGGSVLPRQRAEGQ